MAGSENIKFTPNEFFEKYKDVVTKEDIPYIESDDTYARFLFEEIKTKDPSITEKNPMRFWSDNGFNVRTGELITDGKIKEEPKPKPKPEQIQKSILEKAKQEYKGLTSVYQNQAVIDAAPELFNEQLYGSQARSKPVDALKGQRLNALESTQAPVKTEEKQPVVGLKNFYAALDDKSRKEFIDFVANDTADESVRSQILTQLKYTEQASKEQLKKAAQTGETTDKGFFGEFAQGMSNEGFNSWLTALGEALAYGYVTNVELGAGVNPIAPSIDDARAKTLYDVRGNGALVNGALRTDIKTKIADKFSSVFSDTPIHPYDEQQIQQLILGDSLVSSSRGIDSGGKQIKTSNAEFFGNVTASTITIMPEMAISSMALSPALAGPEKFVRLAGLLNQESKFAKIMANGILGAAKSVPVYVGSDVAFRDSKNVSDMAKSGAAEGFVAGAMDGMLKVKILSKLKGTGLSPRVSASIADALIARPIGEILQESASQLTTGDLEVLGDWRFYTGVGLMGMAFGAGANAHPIFSKTDFKNRVVDTVMEETGLPEGYKSVIERALNDATSQRTVAEIIDMGSDVKKLYETKVAKIKDLNHPVMRQAEDFLAGKLTAEEGDLFLNSLTALDVATINSPYEDAKTEAAKKVESEVTAQNDTAGQVNEVVASELAPIEDVIKPETVQLSEPERVFEVKDAETLKKAVKGAFSLSDEQAGATVDVVDRLAQSIASQRGITTQDFYAQVLPQVKSASLESLQKRGLVKEGLTPKAALITYETGRRIITAIEKPDVSSFVHEFAHAVEPFLESKDVKRILAWQNKLKWDESVSEAYAKGFEKYLSEGRAPIQGLNPVFEKFKTWMADIYKGVFESGGIRVELNDDIRKFFDEKFQIKTPESAPAKEPAVIEKTPRQVNSLINIFGEETVKKFVDLEKEKVPTDVTNKLGKEVVDRIGAKKLVESMATEFRNNLPQSVQISSLTAALARLDKDSKEYSDGIRLLASINSEVGRALNLLGQYANPQSSLEAMLNNADASDWPSYYETVLKVSALNELKQIRRMMGDTMDAMKKAAESEIKKLTPDAITEDVLREAEKKAKKYTIIRPGAPKQEVKIRHTKAADALLKIVKNDAKDEKEYKESKVRVKKVAGTNKAQIVRDIESVTEMIRSEAKTRRGSMGDVRYQLPPEESGASFRGKVVTPLESENRMKRLIWEYARNLYALGSTTPAALYSDMRYILLELGISDVVDADPALKFLNGEFDSEWNAMYQYAFNQNVVRDASPIKQEALKSIVDRVNIALSKINAKGNGTAMQELSNRIVRHIRSQMNDLVPKTEKTTEQIDVEKTSRAAEILANQQFVEEAIAIIRDEALMQIEATRLNAEQGQDLSLLPEIERIVNSLSSLPQDGQIERTVERIARMNNVKIRDLAKNINRPDGAQTYGYSEAERITKRYAKTLFEMAVNMNMAAFNEIVINEKDSPLLQETTAKRRVSWEDAEAKALTDPEFEKKYPTISAVYYAVKTLEESYRDAVVSKIEQVQRKIIEDKAKIRKQPLKKDLIDKVIEAYNLGMFEEGDEVDGIEMLNRLGYAVPENEIDFIRRASVEAQRYKKDSLAYNRIKSQMKTEIEKRSGNLQSEILYDLIYAGMLSDPRNFAQGAVFNAFNFYLNKLSSGRITSKDRQDFKDALKAGGVLENDTRVVNFFNTVREMKSLGYEIGLSDAYITFALGERRYRAAEVESARALEVFSGKPVEALITDTGRRIEVPKILQKPLGQIARAGKYAGRAIGVPDSFFFDAAFYHNIASTAMYINVNRGLVGEELLSATLNDLALSSDATFQAIDQKEVDDYVAIVVQDKKMNEFTKKQLRKSAEQMIYASRLNEALIKGASDYAQHLTANESIDKYSTVTGNVAQGFDYAIKKLRDSGHTMAALSINFAVWPMRKVLVNIMNMGYGWLPMPYVFNPVSDIGQRFKTLKGWSKSNALTAELLSEFYMLRRRHTHQILTRTLGASLSVGAVTAMAAALYKIFDDDDEEKTLQGLLEELKKSPFLVRSGKANTPEGEMLEKATGLQAYRARLFGFEFDYRDYPFNTLFNAIGSVSDRMMVNKIKKRAADANDLNLYGAMVADVAKAYVDASIRANPMSSAQPLDDLLDMTHEDTMDNALRNMALLPTKVLQIRFLKFITDNLDPRYYRAINIKSQLMKNLGVAPMYGFPEINGLGDVVVADTRMDKIVPVGKLLTSIQINNLEANDPEVQMKRYFGELYNAIDQGFDVRLKPYAKDKYVSDDELWLGMMMVGYVPPDIPKVLSFKQGENAFGETLPMSDRERWMYSVLRGKMFKSFVKDAITTRPKFRKTLELAMFSKNDDTRYTASKSAQEMYRNMNTLSGSIAMQAMFDLKHRGLLDGEKMSLEDMKKLLNYRAEKIRQDYQEKEN